MTSGDSNRATSSKAVDVVLWVLMWVSAVVVKEIESFHNTPTGIYCKCVVLLISNLVILACSAIPLIKQSVILKCLNGDFVVYLLKGPFAHCMSFHHHTGTLPVGLWCVLLGSALPTLWYCHLLCYPSIVPRGV